jgi:hypothetical protein
MCVVCNVRLQYCVTVLQERLIEREKRKKWDEEMKANEARRHNDFTLYVTYVVTLVTLPVSVDTTCVYIM